MMADGSEHGRADPAFEAHEQPLRQWAHAIWETWLPHTALNRLATQARRKLASAKRVWAKCTGPGTGMVATATRLRWVGQDGLNVCLSRTNAPAPPHPFCTHKVLAFE